MKKSCKILLARHGETEWNLLRRLQGNQDSPLTDKGIQQAHDLARSINQLPIHFCYTSHLGRARITAELCIAALGLDISPNQTAALQERDFGKWQGQLFESLRQYAEFAEVFNQVNVQAPPAGESGLACGERILTALQQIGCQHPGQTGLVVTHGEAIRCLLALLGKPLSQDAFACITNGILLPLVISERGVVLDTHDPNLPKFLR